jgi:hypothetical protein
MVITRRFAAQADGRNQLLNHETPEKHESESFVYFVCFVVLSLLRKLCYRNTDKHRPYFAEEG